MNERHHRTALLFLLCLLCGGISLAAWPAAQAHFPALETGQPGLDRAFRIAVGDLMGNIVHREGGLLEEAAPVILAGLDYRRPWTRDASINAWNGASLLVPEIARDTLLSVLERADGGVRIGGQYWDRVVWAQGAWHHFLYTGDRDFLETALDAVTHTLAYHEATEYDPETGLFRGPGWSDGVAAYPETYTAGMSSAILDWPKAHPDQVAEKGYGIPMQALSTNCLYYGAYTAALRMAEALGHAPDPDWARKAERLKRAINEHLWMPDKGRYRFFIGPFGGCDYEEALGHAYAILFGVADATQAAALFENTHVTPAGVPCIWPTFKRYENAEGTAYGRHSGTVWPQIQGFWADAAARHGREDLFAHELFRLAGHANRDQHFAEIYHPDTREVYGGMQEAGEERGIILWNATKRQTWAATAYLRMMLFGVAGLRFDTDGLRFAPCLPEGVDKVGLRNLRYRDMVLNLLVERTDKEPACTVNGAARDTAFIPAEETGTKTIRLAVK